MVTKIARKPSTDPVQEKLRQTKADWNKEVSSFINDLIHYKKLMNGWPNKFHNERSFIKDPIPADSATIIGSLVSDFSQLAQQGNQITSEQLEYSKIRRQKQVKPMGGVTAPDTVRSPMDLSQQLASSIEEYSLMAQGSNPVSRFFARLLNPGIGGSDAARIKKYRMSMLKAAIDTFNDLEKLQAYIVGSSKESIFTSSKLLNKINSNWLFLTQGFTVYNNSLPTTPDPVNTFLSGNTSDDLKKAVKLGSEMIADYMKHFSSLSGLNVSDFNQTATDFHNAKNNEKVKLLSKLLTSYESLIKEANTKFGTSGKTFEEIFTTLPVPATPVATPPAVSPADSPTINVLAQEFAEKWLGKIQHQINPFDKTSAIRLDIYKLASKVLKKVDKIMDSLEKEMNTAVLEPLIMEVTSDLLSIKELMRGLEATLRGGSFESPFIDLLEKGRFTESNPNLNDKQREHLKKMLEQTKLRQLTDIYRR